VEELVRRAQRGDGLAVSALIRELSPYVGRICGAIALDDGDDAMQEAFIAIVRNLGSLQEPAAVWGWARRIAVREAVRTAKRRPTTVALDPGLVATVGADVAEVVDVRDALDALAPEQRVILVLRDLEGVSEAEAAALLDVAPGTAKSRLHRARAAFRRRWEA
jgi:DNA-directed RNA polymerase specialized sigma24 family protein